VNEDNFKIKVSGFSRMLEGDKKNQIVEAINDLCQTLGYVIRNDTNQTSKATSSATVWDCWVSYIKSTILA
jgi:thioredoxin reductase